MKNKKSPKKYSGDHVLVMLEKIDDKISLVAEGQQDLRRGQDELKKSQDKIFDRLDKFDARLSSVEDRIIKISLGVMAIETELNGLKRDIKDSYKNIADHLAEIDSENRNAKAEIADLKIITKNKADLNRLEVLEEKVRWIEKTLKQKKLSISN